MAEILNKLDICKFSEGPEVCISCVICICHARTNAVHVSASRMVC